MIETYTIKVPKDSRHRIPVPRASRELLGIVPGKYLRVTIEVIQNQTDQK